MNVSKDIRDRIFAAADLLYEQAEQSAFPTVDAVRKAAKVNMGDASTCMKEWRRAHIMPTASVTTQVPELVQRANTAALASIWKAAQEAANEAMRSAQAGWDAERAEAEALNKQLVDACESMEQELETARARIKALCAELTAAKHAQVSTQKARDAARHEASKAREEAARWRGQVEALGQVLNQGESPPKKRARR